MEVDGEDDEVELKNPKARYDSGILPMSKAIKKSPKKSVSKLAENDKKSVKQNSRVKGSPTTNLATEPNILKKRTQSAVHDFYYKRTCFRTMTLYYKTAFMPFLKKWKSMHRKPDMNEVLIKYAMAQFPGLIESMKSKSA